MWYIKELIMKIYFVIWRIQKKMRNEFVVRLKNSSKTETSVTMTIRIDRELQQKYDELSAKSGHSRNELITMALQYAIDNLHFVEE